MSEHVSARIALLDKQIVDRDRLAFGRVDDVELSIPTEGALPRVEALHTGAEALGDRLGGVLGRWIGAPARRLRSDGDAPPAIDPELVDQVDPFVKLRARFHELEGVAGFEHWLARNLVERLPGAGHAAE